MATTNPVMGDMPMDPEVLADRVKIGPEYVSRRLDFSAVKQVMSGETWVPDADSTFDYIEIQRGGICKVARDRPTVLRFITFLVFPGGLLDLGTNVDPLHHTVRFIVRDVPIDFTKDPFQWSNGLLNFGRQTSAYLHYRTHCVDLKVGLTAGQTAIELSEAPEGWQVGDEVLIPDTRYPTRDNPMRREKKVTIASISGTHLTLSKGLDFEHAPVTKPDGTAVLYSCVCNLTRNIVIESENINGTPGHHANVGSQATWEMQDYMHVNLGRTRAEVLDSTVITATSTHIGTNQIAKYGDHDHHTGPGGAVSFRRSGVILGQPPFKWAMVCHGTHYAKYLEMQVVGYAGSGFVTEDGYETGNEFSDCMALYIAGNLEQDNPSHNMDINAPGIEGAGFWFHGVQKGILRNCEAWNCHTGMLLFNQQQKNGSFPSQPGRVPDTPFNDATARTSVLAICADNLCAACFGIGFEVWAASDFLNVNLRSINNRDMQFQHAASAGVQPHLVNPFLLGNAGRSLGLSAGMAYIQKLTVEGGYIGDCEVGLGGGGGFNMTTLDGVTWQCVENLDLKNSDGTHVYRDVMHLPLPGHDPVYIRLGNGKAWDGVGPLLSDTIGHMPPCRGSQYTIFNWQGTGKDMQLVHEQSVGSHPAMYASQDPARNYQDQNIPRADQENIPEKGLTVWAGWEKYGMAYRGVAIRDEEKVVLEGVKGGYGHAGTQVSLANPPFAVLFWPPPYEVGKIDPFGRGVELRCALVGDYTKADELLYYSVNGGPTLTFEQRGGQFIDERRFFAEVGAGTHSLKTWRQVNPTAGPIVGSERTWPFAVDVPLALVAVPSVLGLTEEAAKTAITGVQLVVGVVSDAHNEAPSGQVFVQQPSAGMQVLKGTLVNISVSTGPGVPPVTVAVPSVVGMNQVDAGNALMAVNLRVGSVTEIDNQVVAGTVIAQVPAAGTMVSLNVVVNLTVSKGPVIEPPPSSDEVWTKSNTPIEAEKSSKGRVRITLG